jgi:hypothetical protein
MATPPRTNTGWKAFGGVPPANHPAYRSAEGRTQETRKEKTGEPEGGHMDPRCREAPATSQSRGAMWACKRSVASLPNPYRCTRLAKTP